MDNNYSNTSEDGSVAGDENSAGVEDGNAARGPDKRQPRKRGTKHKRRGTKRRKMEPPRDKGKKSQAVLLGTTYTGGPPLLSRTLPAALQTVPDPQPRDPRGDDGAGRAGGHLNGAGAGSGLYWRRPLVRNMHTIPLEKVMQQQQRERARRERAAAAPQEDQQRVPAKLGKKTKKDQPQPLQAPPPAEQREQPLPRLPLGQLRRQLPGLEVPQKQPQQQLLAPTLQPLPAQRGPSGDLSPKVPPPLPPRSPRLEPPAGALPRKEHRARVGHGAAPAGAETPVVSAESSGRPRISTDTDMMSDSGTGGDGVSRSPGSTNGRPAASGDKGTAAGVALAASLSGATAARLTTAQHGGVTPAAQRSDDAAAAAATTTTAACPAEHAAAAAAAAAAPQPAVAAAITAAPAALAAADPPAAAAAAAAASLAASGPSAASVRDPVLSATPLGSCPGAARAAPPGECMRAADFLKKRREPHQQHQQQGPPCLPVQHQQQHQAPERELLEGEAPPQQQQQQQLAHNRRDAQHEGPRPDSQQEPLHPPLCEPHPRQRPSPQLREDQQTHHHRPQPPQPPQQEGPPVPPSAQPGPQAQSPAAVPGLHPTGEAAPCITTTTATATAAAGRGYPRVVQRGEHLYKWKRPDWGSDDEEEELSGRSVVESIIPLARRWLRQQQQKGQPPNGAAGSRAARGGEGAGAGDGALRAAFGAAETRGPSRDKGLKE